MVTVIDNTARMVMDPLNQVYEQKRIITIVTVIFLTCGTGGLILIASALWRQLRPVETNVLGHNQTHDKIRQLFSRILGQPAHGIQVPPEFAPAGVLPHVPAPHMSPVAQQPLAHALPPVEAVVPEIEQIELDQKAASEKKEEAERQFSPFNLQAFRAALQEAERKALAKEKIDDKAITIKVNGRAYKAWYTTHTLGQLILWQDKPCGAINIQPSKDWQNSTQTDKIGMIITEEGNIVSIHRDGQPDKDKSILIKPEELPLIKACFDKALQISSVYRIVVKDTLAPDIEITIVKKGLDTENIPEYHLQQMAGALQARIKEGHKKFCPRIKVIFLEPSLQQGQGIDAGGLAKDYISDLITNFIQKNKGTLFKEFTSSFVPRLLEKAEEKKHKEELAKRQSLVDLGMLLMFCYKSSQQEVPFPTGEHFSPEMFQAILRLSAQDINEPFDSLDKKKQFEMLKILLEISRKEDTSQEMREFFSKAINLCSKERLKPGDDKVLIEAMGFLLFCGDDLIPDKFKKNEMINAEKIRENLEEAFIIFKNSLFKINDFEEQIRGLHAVAQGMKYLCNPADTNKNDQTWNTLRTSTQPIRISEAIQGVADRQTICASLVLKEDVKKENAAEITKKVEWLKEWLMKEAADKEVRQFLKYVTAATTLLPKTTITITDKAVSDKGPPLLPAAHTCFNRLDLSPKPYGKPDESDQVKKGRLIKALKVAMVFGDSYGMS